MTSKVSGAEVALLTLVERLDRTRFDPMLLCPDEGMLPEQARARAIPTLFLPSLPPPAGRARDTYRTLLPNAIRIRRLIQQHDVGLVHSNSSRVGYHGGLGARLARVPSIIHERDIRNSPFLSPTKARLLDVLSDRIVAVSEATRTNVLTHFPHPKKVQVIYDGTRAVSPLPSERRTALRVALGGNEQAPLLATIAQLSPWKGQDVVLRALPTILQAYPTARLLVVGSALWEEDYGYEAELKQLAARLGIAEHVQFCGFRRDVADILGACDLLLHSPTHPDPLPNILLEAAAAGALVIASRIGGIPEEVLDGETGWLVPPSDSAALAQAVVNALGDPHRAATMRAAARARVADVFGVERHVTSMAALYNDLLAA